VRGEPAHQRAGHPRRDRVRRIGPVSGIGEPGRARVGPEQRRPHLLAGRIDQHDAVHLSRASDRPNLRPLVGGQARGGAHERLPPRVGRGFRPARLRR